MFLLKKYFLSDTLSKVEKVGRGARVVEWNCLENSQGRKLLVGSNPTLSVYNYCV